MWPRFLAPVEITSSKALDYLERDIGLVINFKTRYKERVCEGVLIMGRMDRLANAARPVLTSVLP